MMLEIYQALALRKCHIIHGSPGRCSDSAKIKAGHSATCDRRSVIPDYVLSRLSASIRQDLCHQQLFEGSVIRTNLDRPLRIFFDNGLEFRLIEAHNLATHAIYHPPRRASDTKNSTTIPSDKARSVGLPDEILLEARLSDWPEIESAEMSAHERIVATSRRKALLYRDQNNILDAHCIDASSFARGLALIALPETTILLNRRHGVGLYWGFVRRRYSESAAWLNADNEGEGQLRPYRYGGGMLVSEALPDASPIVSETRSTLSARRRPIFALRRFLRWSNTGATQTDTEHR